MKPLALLSYVTFAVFFIGGMLRLPIEYIGAFFILLTTIVFMIAKKPRSLFNDEKIAFILLGLISCSFFLGYTQAVDHVRFFSEAEKYWGSFLLFTAGFIITKIAPEKTQIIIRFFIFGLMTTSLFGLFFLIRSSIKTGVLQRLDTPLGMSNDYSSILIIGILLLLGGILSKTYLFTRIIDTAILGFFSLCVLLVRSDAAILGLLAGGFFIALRFINKRLKKFVYITAVLFTILGILSLFLFKDYFFRSGNSVRIALWKGHSEMILQYPLTGVGLSQMPYHYDDWKVPVPNTKGKRIVEPLDAHSFPLNYTAENGIPAFMILLIFLSYYWKKTYPIHNHYYGLLCGFFAFMFSALFSNHFYMIRQMMFVWFLMGIYLAYTHIRQTPPSENN